MSREIEIKRKLKIRIPNGNILSYNSIDNVFKNVFHCNMFDSNIKICCENGTPELYLEMTCKINRQESADLLLNELTNYFSDYNIKKEKESNSILLEAVIYERSKNSNIGKLYKIIENKEPDNKDNWFSVFINDIEFDLYKIKSLIENKVKENIDTIEHAMIDNFKTFTFNCPGNIKYVLDYQDFL